MSLTKKLISNGVNPFCYKLRRRDFSLNKYSNERIDAFVDRVDSGYQLNNYDNLGKATRFRFNLGLASRFILLLAYGTVTEIGRTLTTKNTLPREA